MVAQWHLTVNTTIADTISSRRIDLYYLARSGKKINRGVKLREPLNKQYLKNWLVREERSILKLESSFLFLSLSFSLE